MEFLNSARKICASASELLAKTELKKPVRLIGISVSNMEGEGDTMQMSFADFVENKAEKKQDTLDDMIYKINKNMGKSAIRTGKEMLAEENFKRRREE